MNLLRLFTLLALIVLGLISPITYCSNFRDYSDIFSFSRDVLKIESEDVLKGIRELPVWQKLSNKEVYRLSTYRWDKNLSLLIVEADLSPDARQELKTAYRRLEDNATAPQVISLYFSPGLRRTVYHFTTYLIQHDFGENQAWYIPRDEQILKALYPTKKDSEGMPIELIYEATPAQLLCYSESPSTNGEGASTRGLFIFMLRIP